MSAVCERGEGACDAWVHALYVLQFNVREKAMGECERERVCMRERGAGDARVHALSPLHGSAFSVQESRVSE